MGTKIREPRKSPLDTNKEPGYEYRWSAKNKVNMHKSEGYEVVSSEDKDKVAPHAYSSSEDTVVKHNDDLILMKIKKDKYDQRQADKQAQNDEQMAAVNAADVKAGLTRTRR